MFKYDVGVIGIGRVGLPLALSLSKKGLEVKGFDIDKDIVDSVQKKIMPFKEKGYEEIIVNVNLEAIYEERHKIAGARNIIITVGTPLRQHLETDLSQIKSALKSIEKHIKKGQNIILRSTVAPGTTEFVKNYLEKVTSYKVGTDIFLSFCPERIIEGNAMEELEKLPQIIGSEDKESAEKAEKLFRTLTTEILHTDYVSAELVKLFNNISRYIRFATANQFAVIADEFGANAYEIINMANYKYPRDKIAQPGFTAGTCLRKDFGMINENIPYTDLLLSSYKINEFMPKFLVDNLKKRVEITDKNVAILGYTFKADTDDVRDTLIAKLIRYLEREVPRNIYIHDPYLNEMVDEKQLDDIDYKNTSLENSLKDTDLVYLAVNHTIFRDRFSEIIEQCDSDTWFVDIWDISKTGKIFYKKEELDLDLDGGNRDE
ncbi:nucleotide sugar dehydrogenase [Halocella sp. SP3-1]|uniref:nucleotide sugar dehydrogenase n=1 Tax=Halocella sp. SP3-1 TaxID=2382161 RepID=UPI000F750A51|nr:nucleotide sugar dehydrogenase [Halocella sp. SP3-1]AZO94019.1 nucleotide sugar dehydrogenase [Halocella sp. SP3-1]